MDRKLARFVLFGFAVMVLSACGSDGSTQEEVETLVEEASDPQLAFLEENAKNPDVIVRASGLQIRIIKEGDGPYPTMESTVTVNYHGTLIDGTVFDTTRDNGKPFSFTLDSVIPGWREAMTLMRVGSIYQIFLPSDLAYGARGAGDFIKPGDTLIFEVELISVTQPLNGE